MCIHHIEWSLPHYTLSNVIWSIVLEKHWLLQHYIYNDLNWRRVHNTFYCLSKLTTTFTPKLNYKLSHIVIRIFKAQAPQGGNPPELQNDSWTTNQVMKHLSTSRLLHLAPATGNFLLGCLMTVLTEVAWKCLSLITNLSVVRATVNKSLCPTF